MSSIQKPAVSRLVARFVALAVAVALPIAVVPAGTAATRLAAVAPSASDRVAADNVDTLGAVAQAPKKPGAKKPGAQDGTKKRRNRARPYNPPAGAIFNDPYGGDTARFRIFRHIVRSIDAVQRGQKIRIAAWNLRSPRMASALVNAHRRGVSVRIIMDSLNAMAGNPNRDADYVQRQLRVGNKKRKPEMRSWLRKCVSSCRFPKGIAHTKFYAFSKVGARAKNVVIYGSANATTLSATIQWNDVYTIKGWKNLYNDWIKVFNQMGQDTWVRPPLRQYRYGSKVALTYYAYAGRQAELQGDPTLAILNGIRCQGATGGTGTNGRTKIRIGQTAMHGERGKALARRLVTMKRRGCDIKFVYAMFGGDVVKMLKGAGIGMTHLAYDSNEDGLYDRYIHMKAMAISGVYRGNTAAEIVWNGSANWTRTALESDEVVGEIRRPAVARQYMRWLDRLYVSRPSSWTSDTQGVAERRGVSGVESAPDTLEAAERRTLEIAEDRGIDPYALIRAENG